MLTLETLNAWLSWAQPLMATCFTAWQVPVTYAEAIAFVLSLAMVFCNLRVNPWAWPLSIASSVLFGLLMAHTGLYGMAALQIVFVLLSVWGWTQWLRGSVNAQPALIVRTLSKRGIAWSALGFVVLWAICGYTLDHITDSAVPYGDALPTAGSIVGQWLLARKWVENWPCWALVNVISLVLFATQDLWLSMLLYGIFALLSLIGWRQWLQLAAEGKARA